MFSLILVGQRRTQFWPGKLAVKYYHEYVYTRVSDMLEPHETAQERRVMKTQVVELKLSY